MGLRKNLQESRLSSENSDDLEAIVRKAVREYTRQASEQKEPALKAELGEERRRKEALERQLNELREENRHGRQQAEQVDRHARVRSLLQELGVRKVELAFKLVKDDIFRGEDGNLYADIEGHQVPYKEYLARFVSENSELLPPRIAGGSGAVGVSDGEIASSGFDLNSIRPGMSREDAAQAWKEVARLTGHSSNKW